VKANTTIVALTQYDEFLLGSGNAIENGKNGPQVIFDEMEFWETSRDYLLAFGFIQRGSFTKYVIR